MQFFTAASLLAVVAFQATVQAAPLETGLLAKRSNECGDSTFTGETAPLGSPFIAHCQQIVNQLASDQTFQFSAGFPLDGFDSAIMQSGNCAFTLGTRSVFLVKVGNEDIVDLINDSIRQFSGINSDGVPVVQASGVMGCNAIAASSQARVTWSLGVV